MSRDTRDDRDDREDGYDREDGEEAAPPYEPKNHYEALTMRETFELYRYDPHVRPYVFAVLGALAMLFFVLFVGGSDIGAVIVVLFALATFAFRWTVGPPFLLLFLFWFALFPFGLPDPDSMYSNPFQVRETHFRMMDIMLVLSVLVYLRCQYRIFGLVSQAMPFETSPGRNHSGLLPVPIVIQLATASAMRDGRRPVPTMRRPTSHIDPTEIIWALGIAVVLVVGGQVVWWVVNSLDFVPGDEFPVRWADTRDRARYVPPRGGNSLEFTARQSRFFIILGAMFFGLLLVRLVFGYWRLRMMNSAEGAMILTDTSWSESHRERVRVEKWRIWGRLRIALEKRKATLAERARHEKEDEAKANARKREQEREKVRDRKSRDRDDRDEDEDARPRRRRDRDD